MIDIKPTLMLEDSKGSRYFFYYKDYSIFYREIESSGDAKDTILISQANEDFAAAMDGDDTIYVVCSSRYKGVLLFIYTNYGWKFESVVNLHNSSNIYIMDIIVQNESIHIFFSKKLPIANMYNVYHIHKNLNDQASYIEYSWKKNSLSEIYSQNIEYSYSILPAKGGIIHYASVWYDGTYYYINYYCYEDSIKSWLHKSLNITFKSQVAIVLLHFNKRINLVCFSNENQVNNIHHFSSRTSGAGEIDFKEINSLFIDTGGIIPLFYNDEKTLQLSWIKDHIFNQYTFDDSSAKWKKTIALPITAEMNIQVLRSIKNIGTASIAKGHFILDKDYNISRPIEHPHKRIIEEKTKEKLQAASPDATDYLKQILDEMKDLTTNVRSLNKRIDNLEGKALIQKADKNEMGEIRTEWSKNLSIDAVEYKPLKKSNFKERFLNNERIPDYESLLMKQENINTYVGKPGTSDTAIETVIETLPSTKALEIEKMSFVSPGQLVKKSTEAQNKNSNFLKRLGEFFK